MKDIRPIRGHNLVMRLVAEGEHLHQDFKFAISDARKIAHSLSAFANADGGHLLVGVKDNGSVAGIRTDEDIYLLEQAAQMYCSPPQNLDIKAYRMEDGKIVVKAGVERADRQPVWCLDHDGVRRVYLRVADENRVAHPLLVKAWLRSGSSSSAMLTDLDSRLLALIGDTPGGIDPDHLATTAHVSRTAAETSIVALTVMGLIRFEPVAGGTYRLLPA